MVRVISRYASLDDVVNFGMMAKMEGCTKIGAKKKRIEPALARKLPPVLSHNA